VAAALAAGALPASAAAAPGDIFVTDQNGGMGTLGAVFEG